MSSIWPGSLRRFHPPTCVFVGHRSSGRKQSPATNGKCKRSTCHGMSENLEAAKERWAWWFWCLHPFLPISLPPYLPTSLSPYLPTYPRPNLTQPNTPPHPTHPTLPLYSTLPYRAHLPSITYLYPTCATDQMEQFHAISGSDFGSTHTARKSSWTFSEAMWVTVTILQLRHSLI